MNLLYEASDAPVLQFVFVYLYTLGYIIDTY